MREMSPREAERPVNTYSDLILRLSYHYLHSTHDAEDICQTVFLKLLTSDQSFESPAHEKAWILRTAVNACKDELRTLRRRSVPLSDAAEAPAPAPPSSEVLDAVLALPVKYREAIFLFYVEGYGYKLGEFLRTSKYRYGEGKTAYFVKNAGAPTTSVYFTENGIMYQLTIENTDSDRAFAKKVIDAMAGLDG